MNESSLAIDRNRAIARLRYDVRTRLWMLSRLPHYICHVSLKLLAFPVFATVKVVHGSSVLASVVIAPCCNYW